MGIWGVWGAEKREDKTLCLRNEKSISDSQQDAKHCHDGHDLVC